MLEPLPKTSVWQGSTEVRRIEEEEVFEALFFLMVLIRFFFFCLVVSMSFFIRPRYVRGDRCAPIVLIAETCLERLPQAPWETMLWHFFVAFAQDREGDMGTWHSYHGFGNHWDQELGWKTPIQAQKNSWRRVPCPERIIRKLGEQTNSSHMPPSEPMEKCMMSWCTWQVFCQPKFCPHFLLTDCPFNGPPYSSSQWSQMVHLVRSQVLMNACSWWVMGITPKTGSKWYDGLMHACLDTETWNDRLLWQSESVV